jgi:hypothetical protein
MDLSKPLILKNDDVLRRIAAFVGTKSFNNATTQTRSASRRMNEDIPFGSANASDQMKGILKANLGRYVISEFGDVVENHFAELCHHVRTLKINLRFKTGKGRFDIINGQPPEITQEDEDKFTQTMRGALGLLGRAFHLESLDVDFHHDEYVSDYRWIPRVAVGTRVLSALSKSNFQVLHTLVLNLRANNIDAEDAGTLAGLNGLNKLRTLSIDLRDNNIDIEGTKVLAELYRSESLETLSLRLDRNPGIGSGGLCALAHLNRAPALTTLCLHFSLDDTDRRGLLDMCSVLKDSRNLRILDLKFARYADCLGNVFNPVVFPGRKDFHEVVAALVSLKDAPLLRTLRLKIAHTIPIGGKSLLMKEFKNRKKSNGSPIRFELSLW